MRVGIVAEQLFQRPSGGIGTYVRGLIDALPGAGVEVRSIVARHTGAELASAGLDVATALPLPRRILYESWARFGRPRIPVDVDIVHAPSLVFPSADRRPLVVTVHDLLFRSYPDTYTRRGLTFHERALRHLDAAAAVLCPSEATAAEVRELSSAPSILRVVPLGCDLAPATRSDVERTCSELGLIGPYVLWIGSREPRKNLKGAVEGFAVALERGIDPTTTLVLAGPEGWGSDPTDAVVRRLNIGSNVSSIGFVREDRKAALLTGASAFLFPSLGEGFGLPVLEAMACGVPVVASSRPALPEIADDAAILVDPEDPDRLGEQLARVLMDRSLADDLRRRGLERAHGFTWERTAAATAAAYREVIDVG